MLTRTTQKNIRDVAQMQEAFHRSRSLGDCLADYLAKWVGSWTFLIGQSVVLIAWMIVNVAGWWLQWDPYPFILLNLVLSFQAAFATPVILMSQNRQQHLDERRNHLDLQINLLAEQESTEQLRLLRLLCEKAGIKVDDGEEADLEEHTEPLEIVELIAQSLEKSNGASHRQR